MNEMKCTNAAGTSNKARTDIGGREESRPFVVRHRDLANDNNQVAATD